MERKRERERDSRIRGHLKRQHGRQRERDIMEREKKREVHSLQTSTLEPPGQFVPFLLEYFCRMTAEKCIAAVQGVR